MSPLASTRIDAEAKNAPTSGRLFFLDLGATLFRWACEVTHDRLSSEITEYTSSFHLG